LGGLLVGGWLRFVNLLIWFGGGIGIGGGLDWVS
jgi:hypothetical protein